MTARKHYVGLISGTSVDGIDAVVIGVDDEQVSLVASHCELYPADVRETLLALAHPGINEIDQFGQADQRVGAVFAKAAETVIALSGVDPALITAIGSHGQTIRHRPAKQYPFTLQIGDPNLIAEKTGITTVADFRRRDMAAGGQGAPLAPAFHRAAFSEPGKLTAVVNIGGIANATLLYPDGRILGFDTGPGNTLMDGWCRQHYDTDYDAGGAWAASGPVDADLLARLLDDPYYQLAPPKSTGPEYFNPGWLGSRLGGSVPIASVQRTLLEATAISIADAIRQEGPERVAICGGGAHNLFLLERLRALLEPTDVVTTAALGIDPDWVEAAAFAWLAHRTLSSLPGNEPGVTGAAGFRVLGGIYPG